MVPLYYSGNNSYRDLKKSEIFMCYIITNLTIEKVKIMVEGDKEALEYLAEIFKKRIHN
jgi:hypothetical protein